MLLLKVQNELFVKGTKLTLADDANYLGASSAIREIFYHQNELGYFLYLPKHQGASSGLELFDPINPTSFRWCMFNRQIIFVPFDNNIPFKTLYKIHPRLNDYIIRFKLQFLRRYKKVFIESDDDKCDQYFLLRRPSNYYIDFDTTDETTIEFKKLDFSLNTTLETEATNVLAVMPEFLNSNNILKLINKSNYDDIWKHWLASQYGDRLLESTDRYWNSYMNDQWIGNVISHLVIENMIEAEKPVELDAGLKALLGIK